MTSPMPDGFKHLFFIGPHAPLPPEAGIDALGAKALGLLRLVRLGLPVPPAFVLGTAVCRRYFASGGRLPADLRTMLKAGLEQLEAATGRSFGGVRRPLLVSVRSGAAVSMPGMMETILNVGLCERTVAGLLRLCGNPHLVYDSYRRLVRQFMEVVHHVPAAPFDRLVEQACAREGCQGARELDSTSLAQLAEQSLEVATAHAGVPFPQSPEEQLVQAVEAVFRSWNSEHARHYRRLNQIDDTLGTAVTVQAMVFGNSGASSGSGVGFTRNPASGEDGLYLEFLFNAQGEDVVGGRQVALDAERLARQLPLVSAELERMRGVLESEFQDMQDFEFTVEDGKLYLLQTRAGKRTPWAALRVAVDLVRARLCTPAQALERLRNIPLEGIERTRLANPEVAPLAEALSASIGVASGAIVFDSRRAIELKAQGRPVLLARPDIQTSDIEGLAAAEGILTASGGRTSHGAVVARQLGKVCIVGCAALRISPDGRTCLLGSEKVSEGEELTLDGDAGKVYRGRLAVIHERPEAELAQVVRWRAELTGAGDRAAQIMQLHPGS